MTKMIDLGHKYKYIYNVR